jgi:1-acyl-sn-glycerol-3-phosphate acyltransferase
MKWLVKYGLLRRSVSIPLYFLLTGLLLLAAPLWLPASWIVGRVFSSARSAQRCLCFIATYLICESIGILLSGYLWLRYAAFGMPLDSYLKANSALQFWWAETLRGSAQKLFRLRFDVEGESALDGPGAIVLPRHTSVGDTVFPVSFYALARGLNVRYVLKRELLLDPCLDIVGNRLPNSFVDRVAEDMAPELASIRRLAASATDQDCLVLYMEGTRFTPEKREHVLSSLRERPDKGLLERAETWTSVLPPRVAGALEMMDAAPNKDLLFCAHTGFEGSVNFATLFNGGWLDTTVRIRFWRVPAANIPNDDAARRELLLSQWDKMQAVLTELKYLDS